MQRYQPLCSLECPCSSGRSTGGCNVVERLHISLSKFFGLSNFRTGQKESALSALHGRDVFLRIATGGGKSLSMFLVPLTYSNQAIGVIISPLNSLMDEQISKLGVLGIPAFKACNSCLDEFGDVVGGKFWFVFMSPEVATTLPLRNLFTTSFLKTNLVLVAVDEAHCIYEWGPDFRKSYGQLGSLRSLTKAPFMALTASAPAATITEITSSLCLISPTLVFRNLNREKIFLSVGIKHAISRDFHGVAENIKYCNNSCHFPKTVIFCTRKETFSSIFAFLCKNVEKRECIGMYHASLTEGTKKYLYGCFSNPSSPLCCLISTAFGMGVDVKGIRTVIVYGLPETLSELYQLIGRGGRDESACRADVLTNRRELARCKDKNLVEFCTSTENCRRKLLLRALGSTEHLPPQARCCDVCTPLAPTDGLNILQRAIKRRPRRAVIRQVSSEQFDGLKQQLERERELIISSNLGFQMLGKEIVFPSDVILGIQSTYKVNVIWSMFVDYVSVL